MINGAGREVLTSRLKRSDRTVRRRAGERWRARRPRWRGAPQCAAAVRPAGSSRLQAAGESRARPRTQRRRRDDGRQQPGESRAPWRGRRAADRAGSRREGVVPSLPPPTDDRARWPTPARTRTPPPDGVAVAASPRRARTRHSPHTRARTPGPDPPPTTPSHTLALHRPAGPAPHRPAREADAGRGRGPFRALAPAPPVRRTPRAARRAPRRTHPAR